MMDKKQIFDNICYTELVYGRINRKFNTQFSKKQIEEFVLKILKKTDKKFFSNNGKNYYVENIENDVRLTIHSNTFRLITADRIHR